MHTTVCQSLEVVDESGCVVQTSTALEPLEISGTAVVGMQNVRADDTTSNWVCVVQQCHVIDDRRDDPVVDVAVLYGAVATETNVAAGCIQQSQTGYLDPTLSPLMPGS